MSYDPYSTYGAWVIQCDAIYVMVMALFLVPSEPAILNYDSVREAKCTCLGYETRLSRLYTPDPLPPVSISFLRSSYSATPVPSKKNNQMTPDKSQVSQAGPPTIGLHNSN
jgi:hypothetical protein